MEKTGSKPINELVQAAIQGNGTAFTALWDMYIDQLRAYIRSMMRKQDDLYIDDICSRSFEKAFRQISAFDPSKSQFITWLRVIAHNTALDLKEREDRLYPKNQVVYLDDTTKPTSVLDTIQDSIDTPLDSIIKEESDTLNAGYVDKLPELYRTIARMRLIDGMQYKEIAQELEMPLNTVRTRISRANKLIMQMRLDQED
ncbi:MAG: RNA polymerase sigma factor [Bacteroidales bacterium]|nr:RNA polymerase sigma factor [Bacteroidales bacterium]MBP5537417.1 RNA polymerase sigma factor [Bacteroidales bacterium]MBP5795530.1 RNA polymerase sigma factor [Bacteroidales bacterium]